MPVQKDEVFSTRDVFVDYPFEEVMYRWDHKEKLVFVKFYGEPESSEPVPHSQRLFNDALLQGEEITKAQYGAGKKRGQ